MNSLPWLLVDGRPEAHVLADIAHDYWQIPRSRLVVEDQSTNCGENARFTRTTLENGGLPHRRGIVIQDPTMQRRTSSHLRPRVWQGVTTSRPVAELSGCSPVLEQTDGQWGSGGRALLAGHATWRCCWASCRACGIPCWIRSAGKRLHQPCHLPAGDPRRLATAAGGRPACRGAAGPHPRLKNARLRQIYRKRAILLLECKSLAGHFWPGL